MEEKKPGNPRTAREEAAATHVRVFGVDYRISAGEDPAYIRRVAEYVDRRMREISEESRIFDQSKLAVLTAMDIADELLLLRKKRYAMIGRTGTAADRLARTVTEEVRAERPAMSPSPDP
jgi:cell division protein ZapA